MARAEETISGTVGASGTVSLTFGPPIGRRTYTVDQISHSGQIFGATSVGSLATANLFKNGAFVARTVPIGGTIDGPPPITMRGSDRITLTYRNAVVGAAVEMTVFYDDGVPDD